jgi:two-component system LytT family response regulator
MKILIADDEKPARKKIITFLDELTPSSIILEAENGIDAAEKILNEKPDLVFLDIQMPGLTGFEVINQVGINNMPAVIFSTAYDQYAIDAFDINATDYLLKPFDKARFSKAFYRSLEQIKNKDNKKLSNLIENITQTRQIRERFLVNYGAKYFFVNCSDIHFFASKEKYVEINSLKGKFLLRETMNNIEESIDVNKFARIHRSFIVNVDSVAEIQSWSHGDYIVVLKTGDKLKMSRRYSKNLMN